MDINFGERLKTVRGNIPQKQFAKTLEVHTNTIGRWERNEQSPTHLDLCNILKSFTNINPTWLLTGEGPMTKTEASLPGKTSTGTVDEALLESVLEAVEEFLDEENSRLQPTKKAQLVAALYDMFSESEEKKVNKAVIIRLAKLAV